METIDTQAGAHVYPMEDGVPDISRGRIVPDALTDVPVIDEVADFGVTIDLRGTEVFVFDQYITDRRLIASELTWDALVAFLVGPEENT